MRYDVTRCLLSFLFLVVFAILSSGSDIIDIIYPDKKKPPPDKITPLGDGTYRVTRFDIRGDQLEWEEGPRDAKGHWNGKVKSFIPQNGQLVSTSEYKNGLRHGWTVTYYLGGAIKETRYYENDRLAVPPAPYQSSGVLEYNNLRDSPASPTSSYERLEQTTPWFIDEMEIFHGISKDDLDDFLAEIEARIPAANPQNEDEFIGAFNAAIGEIGKLQKYAQLVEGYKALLYREAQSRLKRLELRLAIFERILGKATSTFSALQKFYPLYLEGLVAKGATLTEIKAYLDDIDSRMDALGPFNMNDPLLAEAIDDRISKVLDDMSKVPDYQTAEMIFRPGPGANNGKDDGSVSGGKDAYAWTCGNAYSGSSTLVVGHPRSDCNQCSTKGYIQFNLDTLPVAVKDVYLGVLHNPHTQSCKTMCNANFYFYPVLTSWNEMTIGSGTMPAEGQAVFGPVNIAFPNDLGVKEYKITDIYTSWKTGKTPNNGLVIYSPDEGCVNGAVMFTFHSSDDPTPANRPYLKIIYFKPVFFAFYMPTLYAYFWSDPVFRAVKGSYGAGDPTVYTSPDGNWGGKMPSYTTIQATVDAAGNGYEVKVKEGDYPENVSMWESKRIELAGGYDDTFESALSFSKIRYLEINKGTIWCKGMVIGPQ
ncbi:MAG: DNRLRE domain-containing protein [Desulfobacteraceae bacterium]|nr:MAG: DNRLRE domain-containing protein [Desulfobacteraceae bacterium]